MTTSIVTNLLGPMCELFYKYKRSLDIQYANINTFRNYGFVTSYSLNFGFELFQPFDLNNINLQPGVFTYQGSYNVLPGLANTTILQVNNFINLQDLPVVGIGTVTYVGQTLPIKISILPNGNSITGIASAFFTGVPYYTNEAIDEGITREFESSFVTDSTLSILVFVNFENTTFIGINTAWTAQETSLYTYKTISYRYTNGYGQFYSIESNTSFISNALAVDMQQYNFLYQVTYSNVYNWANFLNWNPSFLIWFHANKSTVPTFLLQFLSDYFQVS